MTTMEPVRPAAAAGDTMSWLYPGTTSVDNMLKQRHTVPTSRKENVAAGAKYAALQIPADNAGGAVPEARHSTDEAWYKGGSKGVILGTNVVGESAASKWQQTNWSIRSSEMLRDYLAACKSSWEKDNCVAHCMSVLRSFIQSTLRQNGSNDWDVLPFGSAVNGFGTEASDLDATCYQLGVELNEDSRSNAHVSSILTHLLAKFQGHQDFEVTDVIMTARIPILKLRYRDQLDVDLSCNNVKPRLNTWLLRAYANVHSTVRDLTICIKLWARASDISGASRSHLSSYALTLLVIYFMQVHESILLPVLPTDAFVDGGSGVQDRRILDQVREFQCNIELAELMKMFFDFYTSEFAWGQEVVSARTGKRYPASVYSRLRGREMARLHIEDPFEVDRNLGFVLGQQEENQLRASLRRGMHESRNHGIPAFFWQAPPLQRGR